MKKNVLFYKASYFVLWLIALAVLEACTGFIRGMEGGPKVDNMVMLVKCADACCAAKMGKGVRSLFFSF